MALNVELTLSSIAEYIGGELRHTNDAAKKINNLCALNSGDEKSLAMFHHLKYLNALKNSSVGACIIHENAVKHAPKRMALVIHPNPYKGFAYATKLFADLTATPSCHAPSAYVSPKALIGKNCDIEHGAYIGDDAVLGDNCLIGVNTFIGKNVSMGNNCHIHNQVSIENTRMGNDVIIYPGARIGQEGFGFASDSNGHYKIYHQGLVIIGNDVEIGANTCIDRGTLEHTEIGDHVRLDNLIQIGHNVKIGKKTVIAAQSGIAGSSILGESVTLGGQVGVGGHLKVNNHATILGKSLVFQDVPEKARVGGIPAVPFRQWHRQTHYLKKMVSKKSITPSTSDDI